VGHRHAIGTVDRGQVMSRKKIDYYLRSRNTALHLVGGGLLILVGQETGLIAQSTNSPGDLIWSGFIVVFISAALAFDSKARKLRAAV